jgi:hypothetical protein
MQGEPVKLRTLLDHVDEAESAGDLKIDSPVFAVVRNETAAVDSGDAWYAISIVDVRFNPESDRLDLITNESPGAKDISVASLRARVSRLSRKSMESTVFACTSAESTDGVGAPEHARVVDAYGDEHGLGLMLWFAGYDEWLKSQE